MDSKVYVVSYHRRYTTSDIMGVFFDEQKAISFARSCNEAIGLKERKLSGNEVFALSNRITEAVTVEKWDVE